MSCAARNIETIIRLEKKALFLYRGFPFSLQDEKPVVAVRVNILFALASGENIHQVELDLFRAHRLAVYYRSPVRPPMFWRTRSRQSGCMYQLRSIQHCILCSLDHSGNLHTPQKTFG